ncbi:hypothetical protein ACVBEQ_15360 [Nakamurella sp. GG22]
MAAALALAGTLSFDTVLSGPLAKTAIAIWFLSSIFHYTVVRAAYEASDFLQLFTISALSLGTLAPALFDLRRTTILIAIGALMSYEIAGLAKAFSPVWGSGKALKSILGADTFGMPRIALTRAFARAAKPIEWIVTTLECTFFLAIALPPSFGLIILALGGLMHISIAMIMGLNVFQWSYVACYAPIYYLNLTIHS